MPLWAVLVTLKLIISDKLVCSGALILNVAPCINTLNRDYGKTSLHVAAVLIHSQPHTSTKSGKTLLHEAAEKQSICKEVFFYSFMKWSRRKDCRIRLLTVLISTSVNTYFVDSNNFVFGPGLEISSFSSMFQNIQIIIKFSREN